jgi:DNA repair protein RecO (recombination protein O)
VSVRDELTDALLLRSVDYGESDRVLTLLTRRFGKITCIARAARRSKKRFGGVLQPFSLLAVAIELRRAGMPMLQSAQLIRHPERIVANLERVSAGYAGLELIRELTPEHEADDAIFDLGLELLDALDAERSAPSALLVCFEARLLAIAGFAPMLGACGHCGKQAKATQRARFDAAHGHLVCASCGGAATGVDMLSGAARSALMHAAEGAFQEAADMLQAADLAAARYAMRSLTEHRIGRELVAADALLSEPMSRKARS